MPQPFDIFKITQNGEPLCGSKPLKPSTLLRRVLMPCESVLCDYMILSQTEKRIAFTA